MPSPVIHWALTLPRITELLFTAILNRPMDETRASFLTVMSCALPSSLRILSVLVCFHQLWLQLALHSHTFNKAHKKQRHSKNVAKLPYVVARFPFILSRQVFLARLDAVKGS